MSLLQIEVALFFKHIFSTCNNKISLRDNVWGGSGGNTFNDVALQVQVEENIAHNTRL